MIKKQFVISLLLILCLPVACKNSEKKPTDDPKPKVEEQAKKTNPCDNPKTVKELLACANTVGTVDKYKVMLGSDLNSGCDNSWNATDTVLNIVYKDSITLWRVNQKKNTPKKFHGHWFTNFNAKAAGLTKKEVLNRFALNPCPDDKNSYDTCSCAKGPEPLDSVIKYEVELRVGPKHPLQFGVVGKSPFGDGGEIQWHMTQYIVPPYRVLQQIPWD
jgi:hypothetical protein